MRVFSLLQAMALLYLYYMGLTEPFIVSTKFRFFESATSLFSSIQALYDQHEWVLFSIISLSTVVIPLFKISIQFWNTFSNERSGDKHKLLQSISKWSFIDVFVVAIYVVKQSEGDSWMYQLTLAPGFYYFLAFSLLSAASISLVKSTIN